MKKRIEQLKKETFSFENSLEEFTNRLIAYKIQERFKQFVFSVVTLLLIINMSTTYYNLLATFLPNVENEVIEQLKTNLDNARLEKDKYKALSELNNNTKTSHVSVEQIPLDTKANLLDWKGIVVVGILLVGVVSLLVLTGTLPSLSGMQFNMEKAIELTKIGTTAAETQSETLAQLITANSNTIIKHQLDTSRKVDLLCQFLNLSQNLKTGDESVIQSTAFQEHLVNKFKIDDFKINNISDS